MRASIIRRLERLERTAPKPCGSRFIFMPAGCDVGAFMARAHARFPGSEILAVEAFEGDLRDDATAARALTDAIVSHVRPVSSSTGKRAAAPSLETARRIAFAAALMRREALT